MCHTPMIGMPTPLSFLKAIKQVSHKISSFPCFFVCNGIKIYFLRKCLLEKIVLASIEFKVHKCSGKFFSQCFP